MNTFPRRIPAGTPPLSPSEANKMNRPVVNFPQCFSLEMHHIYKFNGETWRYVYHTPTHVTFSQIDDPRIQETCDMATLRQMNASGWVQVIPYGLAPEHLRPGPIGNTDDMTIAQLPIAARVRLEARHAMVRAFRDMVNEGGLIITDAQIEANMRELRHRAEQYLLEELPDPEHDLVLKAWRAGQGRKPRTKKSVKLPGEICARTLRRWVALHDSKVYGGKKALIDQTAKQGNRNSHFQPEELELLAKVVREDYLVLGGKTIPQTVLAVQHTFRQENERRRAASEAAAVDEHGPAIPATIPATVTVPGRPPLRTPGREAVRLHIAGLDKFHRLVARHGQATAMKQMRAVKAGIEVLRPLERVEIDEWKVDLLTLFSTSGVLSLLPPEVVEMIGGNRNSMRWWVTVAICCRTRCILGLTFTPNPAASSAIHCLHMVASDKGALSDMVGSVTPWSMFGTPEALFTDNGAAFRSAAFTTACADLGITKVQTIAGQPAMRGRIERLFRTIALKLLPYLSGRTFGDVIERGNHPAEERACLTSENFIQILVRWTVDVYHNTPHEGLWGQTPLEQWERDHATGNVPLLAAPTKRQKRLAFGFPVERTIDKSGLRILNLQYNSPELFAAFRKRGKFKVDVRWFEIDIGSVEVLLDGKWHSVPAVTSGFEGVDATTWNMTLRSMRRRDPARVEWEQNAIQQAVASFRQINAERQAAMKIVDFNWTADRLRKAEDEIGQPLKFVPDTEAALRSADGFGRVVVPVEPANPRSIQQVANEALPERPTPPAPRTWKMQK